MTNKILILGPPGTGKSRAIQSLNPESTFIICPDEKALPFKGWKQNYKTIYKDKENNKIDLQKTNFYETTNPRIIRNLLQAISDERLDIKVIVIDTITSMMVSEFMSKITERGFEKYSEMAWDTYSILKMLGSLRDDLTVIVISHIEDSYDSDNVLRTTFMVPGGKLVGGKIKVESMFTVILYSEVKMKEGIPHYYFITQNNGKNTCQSPEGMFDDLKIKNDYQYVVDKMLTYNSLN